MTASLQRGKPHLHYNEYIGYDIKPSKGKEPALEIWGMWSALLLPWLPAPLWSQVVLSMGQIEQTVCKQMTYVKL